MTQIIAYRPDIIGSPKPIKTVSSTWNLIDEHNEWEEFHKHTGLESTNRKRPKYDMMPRSNRAPIENGQDEVPFKTYSV